MKPIFLIFLILLFLGCKPKIEKISYAVIQEINLTHLGLANHKLEVKYKFYFNDNEVTNSEVYYLKTRKNWFVNDTLMIKVLDTDPIKSKIIGLKKKEKKFIKSFKGSSRENLN